MLYTQCELSVDNVREYVPIKTEVECVKNTLSS